MRRKVNAEAIFAVIGVLLWIVAFFTADTSEQTKFFSQTLAQAAYTVLTVVFLSLLWKWIGGEPTTLAMEEVKDAVKSESSKSTVAIKSSLSESAIDLKSTVDNALSASLDVLKSSIKVMQDSSNSGIDRIIVNSSNFGTKNIG